MEIIKKLVDKGFLSQDKAISLESEVQGTGKTVEDIILKENVVSEELLFDLKSEITGVSLKEDIDLTISQEILRLIPEDSAKHYNMVALSKTDDQVDIGMVYPEDLRAQEAIKFIARREGFSYNIYLIPISTFKEILKRYRTMKKEVGSVLEELETELEIEQEEDTSETKFRKLAEEAPIIKIVAVILRNAVEGNASDIHVEPTKEKLKVRFRVDGILYSSLFLPAKVHLAVVSRIKILSNMKIDEQRLPQDGRFSTRVNEKNIDFRVSTFPTTLGEKVVIRVLDPKEGLKNVKDLGLIGRSFTIVEKAIKRPTGMTLSTGPTGSGKSTTLYSILNILNDDKVNIVTLEDPVEYFMEGINQSQVRPEIGYKFAQGLRQILRQDPDIIMVGEIRDEETAELAIHASLTGHIVLSTLHTNNAVGVIPRLIDMGIKPFLIPPALNVAMAQRLVKRVCPHCKEEYDPGKEIKAMIMEEIDSLADHVKKEIKIPSPFKIYRGKGCSKCGGEGVIGRIGLFEILSMTDELSDIVMSNPSEMTIRKEANRQGMISLKQDGLIKVLQGETTIEEVLRATEEK